MSETPAQRQTGVRHSIPRGAADLSVIVVTYNSAAVLEDCLGSLAEHLPDAELVVVDNGSSDGTVELAARRPGIRVVAGHGNVGFGAGVNRGAAAASRDLLLVLNPDASLVAVDAAALVDLDRRPLGIAGCRVRGGRDRDPRQVAWGWRAELRWALFQYFLVPRELEVRRPRLTPRATGRWIAGAGFAVARAEFLELGGFDEALFLYYEDFDLCRRYRERDWPIRATEAFTIAHVGQRSSPRNERTMAAYALMSLIQYVHKWEGAGAAGAAARRCLRLLRTIERTGSALGRVPILGPRAARKGREAAQVRCALAALAERPPVAAAYAGAAEAVDRALAGRGGETSPVRAGRPS